VPLGREIFNPEVVLNSIKFMPKCKHKMPHGILDRNTQNITINLIQELMEAVIIIINGFRRHTFSATPEDSCFGGYYLRNVFLDDMFALNLVEAVSH
jgi:hypothetical protein